jgi:NADH dehydrogenase/NADH:ubiquinone oxidoreductase subunit G
MPRTCAVCRHPQRADIDRALVGNETNRDVSIRFGPSIPALQRHRAHHLPKVLARAQQRAQQRQDAAHADAVGAVAQQRQEQEQEQALDVVKQLKVVNATSVAILHEARQAGDRDTALRAIDRITKQIEVQAKLLSQLEESRTEVNILATAEWIALRTTLISVLCDFPDAQAAVIARLHPPPDSTGRAS